MTEAERIQCAMTDLGLPNEYWAYAILLRLCNDVMHARIREFSADNPVYSGQTLRVGIEEIQIFLGTLTDDDTSFQKRSRMLDTIFALLKTL